MGEVGIFRTPSFADFILAEQDDDEYLLITQSDLKGLIDSEEKI